MWTDQELDEVVAFQIDGTIWFGKAAIEEVLKHQRFDNYHSRALFRLMAMLDLDPQWEEYADNAPTLLLRSQLNDSK